MKKLLFIHNHKDFSGAARSLYELINQIKEDNEIFILSPAGSSSLFFKNKNINVIETLGVPRFNHFEIGYYKGFRWLVLIREIFILILFFFKLFFIKIKFKKFDHIHLNEFELVIISPLLKIFFTKKITSHLRSKLEIYEGKFRINFLKFISKIFIKKIIAIDKDCFETSYEKNKTEIIYNIMKKENKNIVKNNNSNVVFGFIGNFLERKGIYDLLLAFKNIHEKKLPIDLIIAGNDVKRSEIYNFFSRKKNFESFILKNKIKNCKNIKFVGQVDCLEDFYSRIDVIIFPSHLNCVGRPVIESALFQKPSIVGLKKYNEDTAIKQASLIFEPGNIDELCEKILFFYQNKKKIEEMGLNAYMNAMKLFDQKKNIEKFTDILSKI